MIDRDNIIRMAREAGLAALLRDTQKTHEALERFAAIVAAAEREACAQVCDVEAERLGWPTERFAADNCAAAIRARSNT